MSYPKPLTRRHHKSTRHRIKNPDALVKQAKHLEKELVNEQNKHRITEVEIDH